MHILAVDVGGSTQDILLFDSARAPEDCLRMVMLAPTVLLAREIQRATQRGEAICLVGETMGEGPCCKALEDHLAAGLTVYATPESARTLGDDLGRAQSLGVRLVSDDEAKQLVHIRQLRTGDLDMINIRSALQALGDQDQFDGLAVAVFDHGRVPRGENDRRFRFRYLVQGVQGSGQLSAFAYPANQIPPEQTRMLAVAKIAPPDLPLMVMDTAAAAVLGALEDPVVHEMHHKVVANVGNYHTLAFDLQEREVLGLFEHHTELLSPFKLETLLRRLAAAALTDAEVFDDHGHGAWIREHPSAPVEFLAVTGPQRAMLRGSILKPYFAVPYGDAMMAGCWGLIRAAVAVMPEWVDGILDALDAAAEPPSALWGEG
ncbi:MAG: DUF1786 domain-containing protein [Chloroflexi bacterium]|nr:DUF1786 domain-containing protein [Chloroflexota bacterium]